MHYGARSLLKKVPISWWPPQEYKLYSLGRFDLYPIQLANLSKKEITDRIASNKENKVP
jgi:hypothetical protein